MIPILFHGKFNNSDHSIKILRSPKDSIWKDSKEFQGFQLETGKLGIPWNEIRMELEGNSKYISIYSDAQY